jgi:hypothetical protein
MLPLDGGEVNDFEPNNELLLHRLSDFRPEFSQVPPYLMFDFRSIHYKCCTMGISDKVLVLARTATFYTTESSFYKIRVTYI